MSAFIHKRYYNLKLKEIPCSTHHTQKDKSVGCLQLQDCGGQLLSLTADGISISSKEGN